MAHRLKINEIFFSIQGESTHAGRPCAFVRLMGCPLRCTYCDTTYAFTEGATRTFEEILSELKKFPTRLVEVTGGEPLAQAPVLDFMQELLREGYEVLLETSGAYPIEKVPEAVKIIMDVKGPSSGEMGRNLWDNMGHLKKGRDEVKFVIGSRADFDFATEVTDRYKLFDKATVLLSPTFEALPLQSLAEWILASGQPFRFQTQMHKAIWGEKRGV